MIRMACDYYGIDADIAVAISRAETGHWTSRSFTEQNNVGGMSIEEVPIRYDSLEDGVDRFVSNLAENYFGQGLDTVEEISKKYCPVNHENWTRLVKEIMNESY